MAVKTILRDTRVVEILPAGPCGGGLEQRLSPSLTPEQITDALGVEPRRQTSDRLKVKHEWSFTVDGVLCGIWDYKGVRWSSCGPRDVFVGLFGAGVVEGPWDASQLG